MSVAIQKINNIKVKPIQLSTDKDKRPILGADYTPHLYSLTFACAKKGSGKTCVVYSLALACASKDTIIIVFCSTLNNDESWIEIQKEFKKRGIIFIGHTESIRDNDQLANLIDKLKAEAEQRESGKNEFSIPEQRTVLRFDEREHKEVKEKKAKYRSPEYIIIFDDVTKADLGSPDLVALCKWHRHFKAKVIISSQYYNDLAPDARAQIDLFLLFGSIKRSKLKFIYEDSTVKIDEDLFLRLYDEATQGIHDFFYVDKRTNDLRINFDEKFIINP